jgi:lipopolysaccharide transport system ATP-binding protein
LKDVSFTVEQGEVLGIIGRNGAGKSTLLKILARVTAPTSGKIKVKGRIASLLEVGTGFHPDLTGRENIYLNGAILGMTREEVRRKFDEIVAFSEIEKFIDTPVKRYSSGMYVRLAFAVAAHLDPEILVVDEVLAVGDAEFQKKCLGKMGEVAKEGRTVLFVSHNMGAIMALCPKAILLEKGSVKAQANSKEVVFRYLSSSQHLAHLTPNDFDGTLRSVLEFKEIILNGKTTNNVIVLPSETIKINVRGRCNIDLPSFRVSFSIFGEGVRLLTIHDVQEPALLPCGEFQSEVEIPALFLRPGYYSVALGGYRDDAPEWIWGTDLAMFHVIEEWGQDYEQKNLGLINLARHGTRELLKHGQTLQALSK